MWDKHKGPVADVLDSEDGTCLLLQSYGSAAGW